MKRKNFIQMFFSIFLISTVMSSCIDEDILANILKTNIKTVVFVLNNGDANIIKLVGQNGIIEELEPLPLRDGYKFKGWYTDETFQQQFDFTTAITENITLYAKWELLPSVVFTVTFNANGGSDIAPKEVEDGSTVIEPLPFRDGYKFKGWYTDEAFQQQFDFTTAITENITLYAKWELLPSVVFTVTFNANGGSDIAPKDVVDGSTVIEPLPFRDGYKFKGWYTDEALQQLFDFTTAITGNITLYAKWELLPSAVFTVTFNANGGSDIAPKDVVDGSTATEPEAPLRDGYEFKGWYTDEALQQLFDFTTAITGNIALYAKWELLPPEVFTVTFNANGGSDIAPQDVVDGSTATEPEAPLRDGYEFKGWYTDEALQQLFDFTTAITGNIALYAKWELLPPEVFTVTFNANGGSDIAPQDVVDGSTATEPEAPLRDGYEFKGWYTDEALQQLFDFTTAITGNIALYAKWELLPPEVFTVTFNANGGSDIAPQDVVDGSTATEPEVPLRDGYEFKGWYTDEALQQLFDFTTAITGNIALYAKWELLPPEVFTVTFNANGGSDIAPQEVEDGGTVTAPEAPVRDGYEFRGWYTDEALQQLFDFTTAITGNITLYAKWELLPPEVFTVTFNANGGSDIAPQEVEDGGTATEPEAPVKDGYKFKGWYIDDKFKEKFYFTTAITGNITLYAKWVLPNDDDEDEDNQK